MTRRLRRTAVMVVLALVAGATVFAQRGGFNRFSGYMPNVPYDGKFTFVRMSYPATGGRNSGGYPAWSHDYPVGEEHFMKILTAVSNLSAHVDGSSVIAFDDPELFKHPVIYLCEPGFWTMSDQQVVALREYLLKGGFMVADDFPYWAWPQFEEQMGRVFPQGKWQDLDVNHPIFHSFFDIATLDIVPAYPQLGDKPIFRAMFEDNDPSHRMYVIANYQNDISEFWEFSETGRYAVDESNEAYKVGVNEFIYGITH